MNYFLSYDPNLTALLHLVFGAVTVGVIAFLGMIYVRSHLVFTCRHIAIEICSTKILTLARSWDCDHELQARVKPQTALKLLSVLDDYPSYDEMWRDLSKWSFDDFYPNLHKQLYKKLLELGW